MPSRLLLALGLLLLAACSPMPLQVSTGRMKAYEISLAASGEKLAMAWHGGVKGRDAIWLQWLSSDGRPSGKPIQITDGQRDAWEPDLQLIDGDPLLVWYEKDPASGAMTAWMERLAADGHPLWRRPLDAKGGLARNPVVRLSGSIIHVAWIETPKGADQTPAVWTEAFDASGATDAPPREAGTASDTTYNLNAAVDRRGAFYVVYDAPLGARASELQLLTIGEKSISQRSLSADDGFASVYPDLAINDADDVGLTWFDERDGNQEVYLRTGTLAELEGAGQMREQRITFTKAPSIGAYLIWNGRRLGLAWCDSEAGQSEVYAETFAPDGSSRAKPRRLTFTATESSIPSIRPWREGFAIGWNEYQAKGRGEGHVAIEASDAMIDWLH